MGDKIKVLLSSRPKLLSDVIRKLLEHQPDMEVVGEVTNPMEFLRAAGGSQVDVLVITPLETNGNSNICTHLLSSYPELKVVTLSDSGEVAHLYRSGAPKSIIDGHAEQSILDAIVDAIRTGAQ
jgi:DNA-binding NarL/FixJ family response regulator